MTSELKHINIDTHLTIKRKSFGKKSRCCNCVVTPRSVWLLQWPCSQVGVDSLISYFSGDLNWKISNPCLCQASLYWQSSWSRVSWGVIKRISMTGTGNHFFLALIIEDPIRWLIAVNAPSLPWGKLKSTFAVILCSRKSSPPLRSVGQMRYFWCNSLWMEF